MPRAKTTPMRSSLQQQSKPRSVSPSASFSSKVKEEEAEAAVITTTMTPSKKRKSTTPPPADIARQIQTPRKSARTKAQAAATPPSTTTSQRSAAVEEKTSTPRSSTKATTGTPRAFARHPGKLEPHATVAEKWNKNIVEEADLKDPHVLINAASYSNYPLLQMIIEDRKPKWISQQTVPYSGWSAAICGVEDVNVLKLLHAAKVDLFATTTLTDTDYVTAGSNVLQAAMRKRAMDSVRFLLPLASMADIEHRDDHGTNAIDLAVCNEEMRQLMEKRLKRKLVSRVGKRVRSSLGKEEENFQN